MSSGRRETNVRFSYAASFMMSLLNGLFTPIVPLLGLSMGASQIELGFIGSATFLVYIPLSFIAGTLSLRFGKRMLLAASTLIYSLACLLYFISSSPVHLMGARLVDGIGMALLWPAVEALLAESAGLKAPEMVSNFGVAWSLGAATGALGSSWFLGIGGYRDAFLPGMVISLILCLAALAFVSGSGEERKQLNEKMTEADSPSPNTLKPVWLTSFLYSFCQGTVFSLYPPYAELVGIPGFMIGLVVASIMTGRTLIFLLFRKLGRGFGSLAIAGCALMALAIMPVSLSMSPVIVLPFAVFLGVGAGLVYAASIRTALSVDARNRIRYAGFFEGSIGLGYLLGPLVGGGVAQYALQGPYIACALVCLGTLAVVATSKIGKE